LNNPRGPSVIALKEENETGVTDFVKTRTDHSLPRAYGRISLMKLSYVPVIAVLIGAILGSAQTSGQSRGTAGAAEEQRKSSGGKP